MWNIYSFVYHRIIFFFNYVHAREDSQWNLFCCAFMNYSKWIEYVLANQHKAKVRMCMISCAGQNREKSICESLPHRTVPLSRCYMLCLLRRWHTHFSCCWHVRQKVPEPNFSPRLWVRDWEVWSLPRLQCPGCLCSVGHFTPPPVG